MIYVNHRKSINIVIFYMLIEKLPDGIDYWSSILRWGENIAAFEKSYCPGSEGKSYDNGWFSGVIVRPILGNLQIVHVSKAMS